jgi:hypothetical protein
MEPTTQPADACSAASRLLIGAGMPSLVPAAAASLLPLLLMPPAITNCKESSRCSTPSRQSLLLLL